MKPLCDCLQRITQEATRVPQSSAAQNHLFGRDGGRTDGFVWPGRLQWPGEAGGRVGRPTREGPPSGWRPRGEKKNPKKLQGLSEADGVTAIVDSWMRPERRLQRLLLPRVLPEDSSPLSARQHKVKLRRRRRPRLNRMSPPSSSKGKKKKPFPASPHF